MQAPLAPPPVRDPVRLARSGRYGLYGVGAGLWLTGAVWLVFHYFLMRKTDFGLAPHPLEHWWLSLHGLFAFAALWLFGLLWGQHIVGGWKSGRRRITGSALFAILALLTASGYLLYYPPWEGAVSAIGLAHWIVGLAALVPFILHRFWRMFTR